MTTHSPTPSAVTPYNGVLKQVLHTHPCSHPSSFLRPQSTPSSTGDIPMCEYLQSIGLDITLINNNGHSAIHKAAAKGQVISCLHHPPPPASSHSTNSKAYVSGFSEREGSDLRICSRTTTGVDPLIWRVGKAMPRWRNGWRNRSRAPRQCS